MIVTVNTWFERDRAHINLVAMEDDEEFTIADIDWWDDEALELLDDLGAPGFALGRLVWPDRLAAAVEQHARDVGLIPND